MPINMAAKEAAKTRIFASTGQPHTAGFSTSWTQGANKREFRINIYNTDYSKDGDRDGVREALKEANVFSSTLEPTSSTNSAGGITIVISREDYMDKVFPKIVEKKLGISR